MRSCQQHHDTRNYIMNILTIFTCIYAALGSAKEFTEETIILENYNDFI